MKKKLLFSLLLGSSFAWMNGAYAATDAVVKTGDAAPAVVDKAGDKGSEPIKVKKYKAINVDGTEIDVSFFKQEERPDIATKEVDLLDGGAYSNGKNNFPFFPGKDKPEGHDAVYVLRKKSDPDALKLISAQDDMGKYPDYESKDPKEWWMYLYKNSKTGEYTLHPYTEVPDKQAKAMLGKDTVWDGQKNVPIVTYSYTVPDELMTATKKELADKDAQLAKGGGASAEQVKALEDQLAKAKQAPVAVGNVGSNLVLSTIVKFQATPEMPPLSFVVTCTTEAALKNHQLFTKFVEDLNSLLTKCPQIVAYMLSKMIGSQTIQDSQSPQFTKDFKTFTWEGRDGVIAEISLEQNVTTAAVNAQLEKIFATKAAIDPTAVAAHINELNANAAQITADLEAQNAKLKAELEAQKLQLEATKMVADDAFSTAEQNKKLAAEAASEAEKAKEIARKNAEIANTNAAQAVKLAEELTSEQQQSTAAKAQLEVEEAARQQLEATQKLLEQEKLNSEMEKQRLQAEADAAKNALEKEEAARQQLEQEKLDKEKEALAAAPIVNVEGGGKKDEVAKVEPLNVHAPVTHEAAKVEPLNVHAPVTHEAAKVEPLNVHAPVNHETAKVEPLNVHAPVNHEAAKVEPLNVHAPVQVEKAPAPTTKKIDGVKDEINVVGETAEH